MPFAARKVDTILVPVRQGTRGHGKTMKICQDAGARQMPDHTRCIIKMMRKSPMCVMFHGSVYLKSNLFHKIVDTAQSNHIAGNEE
jgi:hypothetical protein